MFQEAAGLRPLLPAPEGRVSLGPGAERPSDMRQLSIAVGACVAALAVSTGPALAQNSTPDTYQAARAAGAAAQKVAPPNLVMPADMGGGTYSSRMTNTNSTMTTMPPQTPNNIDTTPPNTSTTTSPNGSANSVPPATPNNIGPANAPPADNSGASKPSTPANGPPNNGNNPSSPNTKPGS